jgi:TP901 family phage tail tape measure protein
MATAVEIVIVAKDQASKALGQVQSTLGGLGKLGVVVGAGMAAAGAAVTGFGAVSTHTFGNFQQGMNEVFTLLPGISKDAMDAMSGDVKQFARDFAVLPDQVVPALYQSLSAGVPQDNVFEFLEVAQKAAKGGVTDLTTAVDGITSVVNAYGAEVVDAAKASDLMFTAVKLGKTDFGQLSSSLFNVIPTASALGVEFGNVTAALAVMTAQGVPTSVATTQLRQLFVELSKSGGDVAETFEKVSGQSFKDFVASGGDVQGALQILEQHAADTGISISDLFGSVEAGAAALSLTGSNTEAYTKALDEMRNATGATAEAYDTMNQGFNKAKETLAAFGQVVLLEVGGRLEPAVTAVTMWFAERLPGALDRFTGAMDGAFKIFELVQSTFERTGSVTSAIAVGISAVMQAFGATPQQVAPVVAQFRELADVVGEKVGTAVQLGRDAWTTFQQALAGQWVDSDVIHPFHRVVGIIGTAIPQAIELGKQAWAKLQDAIGWVQANMETVRPILIGVGAALATLLVASAVAGIIGAVTAAFAALGAVIALLASPIVVIAGLIGLLAWAWNTNFMNIADNSRATWNDKIKPMFEAVGRWLSTDLPKNLSDMWAAWSTDWNRVSGNVTEIVGQIKKEWDVVTTYLTVTLPNNLQTLWRAWDKDMAAIKRVGESVWGAITTAIDKVTGKVDELKGAIGRFRDWIGGISIPNPFAGISIPSGIANLIPGRALGGPVLAGQPYIVGERGPELFIPQSNGYVQSNRNSGMGGGGDTHHHYHINDRLDLEEVAYRVSQIQQRRAA